MAAIPTADNDTRVWYFRGKAYYSERAYTSAIQAYNIAQAKKREAARQQRQAAKAKPAKKKKQQVQQDLDPALSLEAKRLAAQRAAQIRAQLEREARRRAQRIQRQRARELAKAERQRLLEVTANQKAEQQQHELQRQVWQQRLEQQRREAYIEVQNRAKAVRLANQQRMQRYLNQEVATSQENEAERLRQAYEGHVVNTIGGYTEQAHDPNAVRYVPGSREDEREKLINRARKTGNWKHAAELLDKQSKDTGGRYIDDELLKVMQDEFLTPVDQIGRQFAKESELLTAAINSDDIDKAMEIWNSHRFQRLQEEFTKWYGDDFNGIEGKMAPIYEHLKAISDRRERIRISLQVGAPPGLTDGQLRDFINKKNDAARAEALADMTLQERGYLTMADGTIIPYKGRTPGDYMVHWEDYYSRKKEQWDTAQREAVRKAQQYQLSVAKGMRLQGFTNIRFEDGLLTYDDPNEIEWLTRARNSIPDFDNRAIALQKTQFSDPYQFEKDIHAFMKEAEAGWIAAHPAPPPSGTLMMAGRGAVNVDLGRIAWEKQKQQFLDETYGAFTGSGYGLADSTYGSPVGTILDSALTFWSAASAGVRWGLQQGAGRKAQPFIDLHFWGDGPGDKYAGAGLGTHTDPDGVVRSNNLNFGQVYDDNADEAAAMVKAAFEGGDWGEIAYAIREYSQWGQGNVGWALTQLVDPTQFVGISAHLAQPVRQALARVGGLKALFKDSSLLGDFLRNYADIARPARRGFGRGSGRAAKLTAEARNFEWARIKMAQAMEMSYKDVMHQPDEWWQDLVQRFTAKKGQVRLEKSMADFLKANSALPEDFLMARAQKQIPKIAKEYKLLTADPLRIAKQMAGIEGAFVEAKRAADDLASEVARREAQAAAAPALATLRKRFPRDLTQRPARTVAAEQAAEHARLLTEYVGSTNKFVASATRAKSIMEEIGALGRSAKRSTTIEGAKVARLQSDLRTAIAEMADLRDKWKHLPGGGVEKTEGAVSKNWRALQDYRATIGGDPDAPSFSGILDQEIASDFSWLTSRIRGLTRSIRAETDPTVIARLRTERDLAKNALGAVKFEREARSGRAVARRAMKEHPGAVDRAVHKRALGAPAHSVPQRILETARSLSGRLGQTEIQDIRTLTKHEAEFVDAAVPRLQSIDVTQVLLDHGIEGMGDVTLLEALMTFEKVMTVGGPRAVEFEAVWKSLLARAKNEMRALGWKPYRGLSGPLDFIEILRFEHARGGAAFFDVAGLEALDAKVADALREVRGFRAEGLIRKAKGAKTRWADTDAALLYRSDLDPREVLAKIRALKSEGVDLYQYDMLRASMGDIMRRKWSMTSILEEAQQQIAKTGGKLEDAYDEIWSRRAKIESRREFEEFSLRPEFQGLTPRQLLSVFEETYMARAQGKGKVALTQYQYDNLAHAYQAEAGHAFSDQPSRFAYLSGSADAAKSTAFDAKVPPFGNRTRMSEWLVTNGYWPKRLGEEISRGQRTWSIDDERNFFESNWGYTPPWTDPVVMKPLLNNQTALNVAFESWGMMDDGFERLSSGVEMNARQIQGAIAWGAEGFQRQRTFAEIRRYAMERYGELISADGKTLDRMPWLMADEDEYVRWTRTTLDESASLADREARAAEWNAAKSGLPEPIQKAMFDGDSVKADGLDLLRGNLKPAEVTALNEAIEKATRKRFQRMVELGKKTGDPDPRRFLPQEQVRFAMEVTNELMADQRWRYIVKGDLKAQAFNYAKLLPGTAIGMWGQLFRTLVSWQPAFAIMNLIDSFGFKRVYLQVYQNGFRPLGWDADGRALVRNLEEAGLESRQLFSLRAGASSFEEIVTRVGDQDLSWNIRGGAAVSAVTHLPILVSKMGEDRLRLQFAQSVAGKAYRGALRQGLTEEAAREFARAEAKRVGSIFFVPASSHPLMSLINDLVPFFSYNFNNKVIALRMAMDHPQVYAWADRIGRQIENANRERWEKEHPGLPFPEGPSARWLWVDIDGHTYKIDLTTFSDWTRALQNISQDQSALDWATQFFRVPHPSQLGLWAVLTGGETPWGKPGDIEQGGLRELSFWVDLLYWMNGRDYANWDDRRDAVQMMSQMLFFKKFGTVLPVKIKQMTYFAMTDAGDYDSAKAYLDANPDLLAYWASKGKGGPDPFKKGGGQITRYSTLTQEERDLYRESFDEFQKLNAGLDAAILLYAKEPWSPEYRAAKKEAFNLRTAFLANHPELVDYWTMFQSPKEFAAMAEGWKTDIEVEAFFSMKRPNRDDFKDDLSYNRALVKFYDRREKMLDSHPALRNALFAGRTAIERAWHDQELQWTEILEAQARVKIKILEEQLNGASADRDMISVLYEIRGDLSQALDAERYSMFDRDAQGNRLPREEMLARIPGFGAVIRAGQTPEQRAQSDANLKYARGIAAIVKQATDGKSFYDLLSKDPALLREYWRRNPDAKARFEAGAEYVRLIGSWAQALQRNDFTGAQRIWDSLPAWVKERYFEAHPDSGMRDGMGAASGAVEYKGQFFKSIESRNRYIYFIEQGGQGPIPKGSTLQSLQAASTQGTFSSPEARMRFIRGQEYYSTIGGWIDLLKAKDYDKADKYFKAMPTWMQEKYFESHPDDRARFELDSEMLRAGAEYFLAKGDDKARILDKFPALARWLKEHGGEEAEFRGLINAIYRAIPSSEAWLKRKFRDNYPEIFSQEAAGEGRLRSVASDLAQHPEVYPFYLKAVKLQYRLFQEQLKRNETPPKPWTMERKKRLKHRARRRGARMHSLWSLHRDTRRGAYAAQDRLPRP